jgi:hypothetical protein
LCLWSDAQGAAFPLDQSRVAYLRFLRRERKQASPRSTADTEHAKAKTEHAKAKTQLLPIRTDTGRLVFCPSFT